MKRTRGAARAILALASMVLALPAPTTAVAGTPVDCILPGIDDRCERWAQRYTEGEGDPPFAKHAHNRAEAGALSPNGARAFVVGSTVQMQRVCPGNPPTFCQEMQTVGYDAATGALLWSKDELPPWENSQAIARTVVVSADGTTVYSIATVFTGAGSAKDTQRDIQIVAYDAATGAKRWSVLYDGPAGLQDDAFAAVASPVDDRLFVAATSASSTLPVFARGYSPLYMHRGMMIAGLELDIDMALLTFDGATGELLDEERYGSSSFNVDGEPHGSWDAPTDIEIAADGSRVLLAGVSDGRETYKTGLPHSTVVAFDATGDGWERSWVREVAGTPIGLGSLPAQDLVAFLGANAQGGTASNPYAVLGLEAGSGATRWETKYTLGGLGNNAEYPRRLLADPVRGLIHLPGISGFPGSSTGAMGVLSLRATDGSQAWRKLLRDPRSDATIIFNYDADRMPTGALDPLTGHVLVTSERESELATISLDGATGAQRWVGLFENPVRPGSYFEQSSYDWPMDMEAVGGRAVVFGNSYIPYRQTCQATVVPTPCSRGDYLTVAYDV